MDFSPDCKFLFTGSIDGTAKIFSFNMPKKPYETLPPGVTEME
jgi:WD40 repeat protein